MLSPRFPATSRATARLALPARQRGVVLLVALIILVALMLGGIALVRSVGTANLISGNLAFQQSATQSGEAGTEAAITTIGVGLATAMSDLALQNDNFARAYAASTPAAGNPADWDAYWATTIDPLPAAAPGTCKTRVCTLPVDAAGNTVSYTIQRLCQTAGDPIYSGCAIADKEVALDGGSLKPGPPVYQTLKYYYRITSRIVGPRNTVSYIQTIVAR